MSLRSAVFIAIVACAACETPLVDQADQPTIDPPGTIEQHDSAISYRRVADWPALPSDVQLGEVAGITVDSHGHVFVFQRASRGWDTGTVAPISDATVLQIDARTGVLLARWGSNRFRLPHGLSVDGSDNVWLTDAALHQVFQFSHEGELRLAVGEAGVGQRDATHFNRPTDVAVRGDGGFYVTDGYEAQRVLQFDRNGRPVREWGKSGFGVTDFRLPHGIALSGDRLLIADRENGRLVIYDTLGIFRSLIVPIQSALVYAVATEPGGGTLVAVQGNGIGGIIRLNQSGQVTHGLGAVPAGDGNFLAVHDVAAGADGSIYVAETRAGGLRKYLRVAEAR